MTIDIQNSSSKSGRDEGDADILKIIELLFFAYRDFISDPDVILEKYNFGRAHHRVIHFVEQHPGLRINDLLEILKITKQSLGRVLKQLIDEGFIDQVSGKTDRRERLLYATDKGRILAKELRQPQIDRVRAALSELSGSDQQNATDFLFKLINQHEQAKVQSLTDKPSNELT